MKISQKLFHLALSVGLLLLPILSQANTDANDNQINHVVNGIIKFDIHKLTSFGKLDKIVLDAGHGGKDHGCSGSHSKEKFIVLDIAKKLGALIRFYHPEIEVIYTRDTDVFLPLDTRIGIANKSQADLFISIHANYISKNYVRGTETYVMGLHRAEENLAVAKRENAVILHESDYENTYGGYNPNSSEAHILLSMYQNAYLDKSINFATKVENSFASRTILKSRGVKQAGFLVLRKATMPSALIETGFLSSHEDEAYLLSQKGQDEVANAILKAVTEYKREVEGEYWLTEAESKPTSTTETPSEIVNNKQYSKAKTSKAPKKMNHSTHFKDLSHVSTPQLDKHQKTYSGATGYSTSSPSNSGTLLHQSVQPNPSITKTPSHITTIQQQQAIISKVYRVQIAAGKNKLITTNLPQFKTIDDLEIIKEENMFKYLTGSFLDLADAYTARETMIKRGFKGAFIVIYDQGKRINL